MGFLSSLTNFGRYHQSDAYLFDFQKASAEKNAEILFFATYYRVLPCYLSVAPEEELNRFLAPDKIPVAEIQKIKKMMENQIVKTNNEEAEALRKCRTQQEKDFIQSMLAGQGAFANSLKLWIVTLNSVLNKKTYEVASESWSIMGTAHSLAFDMNRKHVGVFHTPAGPITEDLFELIKIEALRQPILIP